MRCTARLTAALLFGLVVALPGCAEENTGDLSHRDLGDDTRALVPTGSTFTNPAVAKGTAPWKKLREPSFAEAGGTKPKAAAADASTGTAGASAAESAEVTELRELIGDYNAAVAEHSYEDAVGFLVESQVETAEKLVKLVPELADKASQLNAALPAPNADLAEAVDSIALPKLLHLEVGAIKIVSDASATGELAPSSGGGTVKFVVEDEDWYLVHPMLASVGSSIAELEQGSSSMDQAIAGIKSGALAGDAINTAVDDALDALILLTPKDLGSAPESSDTVGT